MSDSGDLKFWGIDWAKGQWLCIGLGKGNRYDHFFAKSVGEAHEKLQEHAETVLIDIPIGLSDNADERQCDISARVEVGNKNRKSSVFRVPCRQAIDAYKKDSGDEKSKELAGKIASVQTTMLCLSEQTWNIVPQIAEMDSFLCEDKGAKNFFREFHPEVCFRAFADEPLCHSKKTSKGFAERMDILLKKETRLPKAKEIYDSIRTKRLKKEVGDDDILDALVGAITVKRGGDKWENLQCEPPQMVYFSDGEIKRLP